MCGIVGYIGYRDCSDVLVSALEKLEYRGYDSAGIAVFENDSISVKKAEGKILNLKNKISLEEKKEGYVGIGHTRWATHGKPSDVNSHPHKAGQVTIVHNGIIENYKELKDMLISKGANFLSDTDTEVVSQLLNYYYDGDPMGTIKKVVAEIHGSYALGILFEDKPNVIYAIRHESPLVVGVGENENFIASDMPAIINYTKKHYLLEHEEIAVIEKDNVEIFDLDFNKIDKPLLVADWDIEAAEKGGYDYFMLKEIHEQPTVVKTTLTPYITDGMPDFSMCGMSVEQLKEYKQIFIVACGTAMHAGVVAKYLIEKLARVPVIVDVASEFRYRNPIVGSDDLVIIISQSGETADSLEAMRLSKRRGAKAMAVVNVKGSSIAREADIVVYTHAGPEIAVASTKAYMVQIATMYLFAFEIAFAKGKITKEECANLVSKLLEIPELLKTVIDEKEQECNEVAKCLIEDENLLFIGRGLDYAASMEGSLKLKEISYIHSESYAAGELKHGTISLITEGMPVIAVATQKESELLEKTVSNIKEVRARGAKVILVAREDFEVEKEAFDYRIDLPYIENEILMPMLSAVPLQLIAYYTSDLKGNDVDKPRNLAKSVTVE